MGADVCITGSSEHILMMTSSGDHNSFCCYSWVRSFSHTALQKFLVKKHARISASEIRVK